MAIPPVPSQVAKEIGPHTTVVVEPSGGRWFAWFGWLGLVVTIPALIGMWSSYHEYFDDTAGIQEKYHSLRRNATDKIAVIRAAGVLANADGFVKNQIDRVRKDKHIKAIVLRIDSPGGTVAASDYIYYHLKKLREEKEVPLVVSMGSMAASGGYYIAMAVGDTEDTIFAEPTTTTGSIGVIIPHYNFSELMEKYGVTNDSIVSHPRKQLLSMSKPPSEEDRAILQAYVDESFHRFKEIVKSGRPIFRDDDATLSSLATGEIFTAEQARQAGLVDQVGFVEDAVLRAIELANLDKGQVRAVTYTQPASLAGAIGLANPQATAPQSLLQSILDLTTPRAYYLFTSLPGVSSEVPVR